MKYTICILLLFSLFISCGTKEEREVSAIAISYDNKVRFGDIILAKDSSTIESILDTAVAFNHYKRYKLPPEMIVVKTEALKDLYVFVNKHCNEVIDEHKMDSNIYFVIRTFSDKGTKRCYYYLEDDGIQNYFQKMLEHLNNSKYSEDFKELVPSVEKYISNCEKIKKYGKEDWINH